VKTFEVFRFQTYQVSSSQVVEAENSTEAVEIVESNVDGWSEWSAWDEGNPIPSPTLEIVRG
jgi:hypothetical protein